MKKLIIQIPCYNEEQSLPVTLKELPRHVDGYDKVEWLIIDDGSTDDTATIAKEYGVDYVIRSHNNRGLAKAFMAGIESSLRRGADTIVNLDADNQYSATSIPDLVKPILKGEALIVIGARPIGDISEFSFVKKWLQRLGSWVVRKVSTTDIPDAPSGFRAIHKEAAMRLYVFSRYTYTLETIIQAGRQGIAMVSVPVRVNGYLRPSRLVRSIGSYVFRSILTIFRIFVLYKPLRFFAFLGAFLFVPGFVLGLRFLIAYWMGEGAGHIQSLILAAILILSACFLWIAGILSDLIASNRMLLEDIRWHLLRTEIERLEEKDSVKL